MKTLFLKDLRENFKLPLIALAVFTILLVTFVRSSDDTMTRMVRDQITGNIDQLQPLLSKPINTSAIFLCAIFGTVLGWLQTRNEAHRDLWAFLVHRPITRSQIFWSKALAGVCLYTFGAGLPILALIIYVQIPGNIAAPFQWAMALPLTAIFLNGIGFYFAGVLTEMRKAHWFGSRTFGLGVAILTAPLINHASEFYQTLYILVPCIAILSIAAWGSYQSTGYFNGQPWFGKLALTIALTFGSFIVLALVGGLIQMPFATRSIFDYSSHVMTRDGVIYIHKTRNGQQSITDLAGKPVLDPKTGKPMSSKEFNPLLASSLSATSSFIKENQWGNRYNSSGRFFTLWNISQRILWYVDNHGKLTSFNSLTRQPLGDLVPKGAHGDEPFISSTFWNNYYNSYNPPHILATASTVYLVELDPPGLKPLFQTAASDPITGFAEWIYDTNILVLTHQNIQVVDSLGRTRVSMPYQPEPPNYPSIDASPLNFGGPNRYAIRFNPDYSLNEKSGWKLPEHFVYLNGTNIEKTVDFPYLRMAEQPQRTIDRLMNHLVPLAFQVDYRQHKLNFNDWACVILAALGALVGWVRGRRYSFTNGRMILWLSFIFLLGIPGLLTFLCALEWPKLETCPHCNKLRRVDHEHCDHCEAAFTPPEKIGIEIFEPLEQV